MKNTKYILAVLCFFALAACAGPVTMGPQGSSLEIKRETELEREMAYKQIITDQDRLFSISFPLLAANADFCGENTAPAFGMTLWNIDSISTFYRPAVRRLYGLHAGLAVQLVADRSPADRAGVHSGDLILSINGMDTTQREGARRRGYELLQQAGNNPVQMLLERNGKRFTVTLHPARVCKFAVVLDYESDEINAYADGEKIVISKGIVRFAQGDNELALIVAHELGHNAMRHIDKQKGNALIGTLGGLAIDSLFAAAGVDSGGNFGSIGGQLGGEANSVEFEQEADYVGMYFMERAGFNSAGVAHFWRRMAIDTPSSVKIRTTHPTSPERFIAIERTHDEIVRKKTSGQKLVPNFKPK